MGTIQLDRKDCEEMQDSSLDRIADAESTEAIKTIEGPDEMMLKEVKGKNLRETFTTLLKLSRNPEYIYKDTNLTEKEVIVDGLKSTVYVLAPDNPEPKKARFFRRRKHTETEPVQKTALIFNTGILSDSVMYGEAMEAAARSNQEIWCYDFEHATPKSWPPARLARYHAEVAARVAQLALDKDPDAKLELLGHSRGTATSVGAAEILIASGVPPEKIELFLFNPTIADLALKPKPMLKIGYNILKHIAGDVLPDILADSIGDIATIVNYQKSSSQEHKDRLEASFIAAVYRLSKRFAMAESLKENVYGKSNPQESEFADSDSPGSDKSDKNLNAGNATLTLVIQAFALLNGMDIDAEQFKEEHAGNPEAPLHERVKTVLRALNKADSENNYVIRLAKLSAQGVKANVLVSDYDTVLDAQADTLQYLAFGDINWSTDDIERSGEIERKRVTALSKIFSFSGGVNLIDITKSLAGHHSGILTDPPGTGPALELARQGFDEAEALRIINERRNRETEHPLLLKFVHQLGGLTLRLMRQQLNQRLPESF